MKVGTKIAEGGCSEVFEWNEPNKIIKLAKPNTNHDALKREYHNNRMAWEHGVPAPQPFEFVDMDGRPGIVLERIDGETLLERYLRQAGTGGFEWARMTAQVLSEIHKISIENMPSQSEIIKSSIRRVNYLTHEEKEAVITILTSLPLKQQLCHGDPNPNNIMIQDGKAIMIDWMDACAGNPEADLAEFVILIRYAVLPEGFPAKAVEYFNATREVIIETFVEEYTKLMGITYEQIEDWIIPAAARKLSADAISESEKNVLVRVIRDKLGEFT